MVRNCPVDVISVCNTQGEIRPLRFQLEDEEHQLLRVNSGEQNDAAECATKLT